MKNKLIYLCLLLVLLAALPLSAMAQELDYDRTGSVSVTLVSLDGEQPMAGAAASTWVV